MDNTTKWIVGALVFLGVAALVIVLGGVTWFLPFLRDGERSPEPTPSTQPAGVPGIADGDWFAMVTVGTDETGAVTLGVDIAEMLTGDAAHDAAVVAGVIGEDEELPNDFFIDNPESTYELMHVDDAASITVISADDVSHSMAIDVDELADLYEGTYVGSAVYGIGPGQPIAMDLTIQAGLVTSLSAVYLP